MRARKNDTPVVIRPRALRLHRIAKRRTAETKRPQRLASESLLYGSLTKPNNQCQQGYMGDQHTRNTHVKANWHLHAIVHQKLNHNSQFVTGPPPTEGKRHRATEPPFFFFGTGHTSSLTPPPLVSAHANYNGCTRQMQLVSVYILLILSL